MEGLAATLLQADPKHAGLASELDRAGFMVTRVASVAQAIATRPAAILFVERALVTEAELSAIARAHGEAPLVILVDDDPPPDFSTLVDGGADDWIAPMTVERLAARLRALGRRASRGVGARRALVEQRLLEAALRESEARHRRIFDANLVGVVYWDGSGSIVEANDAFLTMLGYARDDIGSPELRLDELTPPEFRVLDRAGQRELDEIGHYLPFRKELVRKDGSRVPVLIGAARLGDDPDRGLAMILDLSEQRVVEERLGEAEARYRTMFEHAPEAILVIDTSMSRILEVNDNATRLFGRTHEAFQRIAVDHLSTPRQPDGRSSIEAEQDIYARALAGETPRFEWQFMHLSGKPIPCEVSVVRLAGTLPIVRSSIVDITDRKALERRLFDAARMASVGTLASGVAHEINNPLAYVTANVRHTRDALAALGEGGALTGDARVDLVQALDEATHGAARVQRIVNDLRAFSRVDVEAREPVDVRGALEIALAMATGQIRHRARLVVDQEPVPQVLANESRLGQVLLNLLMNAAEAIPPDATDPKIQVAVTRFSAASRVAGRGGAADAVEIAITDNGRGISPAALPRIFDPFFTDKPIGEGSGLGLAICHGLVTSYGGEIIAESELGKGTTMRVRLPIAERERAAPPKPAPLVQAQRRGRVLVIDDEPLVARAVGRTIASRHEVTTLTRAREVLERIEGGERFDAILCDLMMPDMTGMELFDAVGKIAADQAQRMIFMTGGAFTPRARAFLDGSRNPRLDKPFAPEALFAMLASVIDSP